MSDEMTEMAAVFRLRMDAVGLGRALMEFAESIAEVTYARGMEDVAARAREEGRREGLEEAHRIVVEERDAYAASAAACDAAGNFHGGTTESAAALTCERIADRVRSLASPRGEGNESKEGT